MIALKSQVPLTIRREEIIVRAYLSARHKEDAMAFAEGTGKEEVVDYTKQQIEEIDK